jgi:type II secretory ATPase GspE/PulE/Tfp pilus assembly ATPase PilB-like protein
MSSLVITERRVPQDGQFRVSTLPCIRGEKIVMRVLGQSKLNSDLSKLDMTPREVAAVEGVLKSPHGLILVTGPTGSGKTTLYTMINVLNKPDVNIMTAEDPVEYEVPDVNQVKIKPGVGLTSNRRLGLSCGRTRISGRLKTVDSPGGCPHCHGSGYNGRKALFEVMPVQSTAMRQLITSSTDADLLSDLAGKEGMTTLRRSALSSVVQRDTSMQEALKVMMG